MYERVRFSSIGVFFLHIETGVGLVEFKYGIRGSIFKGSAATRQKASVNLLSRVSYRGRGGRGEVPPLWVISPPPPPTLLL